MKTWHYHIINVNIISDDKIEYIWILMRAWHTVSIFAAIIMIILRLLRNLLIEKNPRKIYFDQNFKKFIIF